MAQRAPRGDVLVDAVGHHSVDSWDARVYHYNYIFLERNQLGWRRNQQNSSRSWRPMNSKRNSPTRSNHLGCCSWSRFCIMRDSRIKWVISSSHYSMNPTSRRRSRVNPNTPRRWWDYSFWAWNVCWGRSSRSSIWRWRDPHNRTTLSYQRIFWPNVKCWRSWMCYSRCSSEFTRSTYNRTKRTTLWGFSWLKRSSDYRRRWWGVGTKMYCRLLKSLNRCCLHSCSSFWVPRSTKISSNNINLPNRKMRI